MPTRLNRRKLRRGGREPPGLAPRGRAVTTENNRGTFVVPMNALNARRKKAEDDTPKEVSEEVQLLTEIRDALAKGDRA